MRVKNEDLTISSVDLQSNITSDPLWLSHIVNYSIQATVSGTPNGTFKLQGSNDFGGKDSSSAIIANWADLSIEQAVTAAGSYILQDKDCGYKWVRLVWTDSSSGASSEIEALRFNVKGV
jgi:hypothetical protein